MHSGGKEITLDQFYIDLLTDLKFEHGLTGGRLITVNLVMRINLKSDSRLIR